MRRLLPILTVVMLAACGTTTSSPPAQDGRTSPATDVGTTVPSVDESTQPPASPGSAPAPAPAGSTPSAAAVAAVPPVAMVAADGTVWLDAGDGTPLAVRGVLDADARVLVGTLAAADDLPARAAWIDVPTAETLATVPVGADLHVAAVTSNGDLAVLTDAAPGGTAATSHILAVDRRRGVVGEWSLAGNLVPEAFADAYNGDATGLPIGIFVIEYVTSEVYRVRVLETSSGVLSLPLNLRDKSQFVDASMKAVSRTAVFDPTNRLLFTLYQGIATPDHPRTAFVHTLGLINGVYCLDVPAELDLGVRSGAVAVEPGGRRLYVASPTGGVASFLVRNIIDASLTPGVDQLAQFDAGTSVALLATATDVYVAINDGGGLPTAGGATIIRLDPTTLTERSRLHWDGAVEAMAVTDDGGLLLAGSGRVSMVDAAGTLVAERVLPPAATDITRLVVTATT